MTLTDPATDIVTAYLQAMSEVFDPNSENPPDNGTTVVHFFGGDAIPMAAWEAHSTGDGCDIPFLWVRLVRRFRTDDFPSPAVDVNSCGLPRVLEFEVGVGRCAVTEIEPSWEDYAIEAAVSLDDSWRIELALCRAGALVRRQGYSAATGEVLPYGPEGGVLAWTGVSYVQF